MEAYEDGDSSADDNIRDMVDNNQLKDAVFSCINAASFEFFPDMQRAYLKVRASVCINLECFNRLHHMGRRISLRWIQMSWCELARR